MIRFIVKNKHPTRVFVVNNELLRFLFLIRSRSSTDMVFLLDENDLVLLDEMGRALVD